VRQRHIAIIDPWQVLVLGERRIDGVEFSER
jgi:hypothetical protein